MTNVEASTMRRQQEKFILMYTRSLVYIGAVAGLAVLMVGVSVAKKWWMVAAVFIIVALVDLLALAVLRKVLLRSYGLVDWMKEQGW